MSPAICRCGKDIRQADGGLIWSHDDTGKTTCGDGQIAEPAR